MRLVLALVSVLALVGAGAGQSSVPRCARDLPHMRAGVPDAIALTTDCASFRLEPDGRLAFAGSYTLPVSKEADSWSPFDDTWSSVEHGHAVVGRGMQRLWRSRGGGYPRYLEQALLGERDVAFVSGSALYVARYGGPERVVARGESPLVFSKGNLVTERGATLFLRAGDGRLERVLARHASDIQPDWQSKMVLFRSKGRLFVFDGVCVRDLVSLRKLGVGGRMLTVEPLGRLVAVRDARRLVVLDYDGRVLASTRLPTAPKPADGISSAIVPNPAGTAVAFTATNSNTAMGTPARETVYVLMAGERRARPVFSETFPFHVCERMADLEWRGRLILYSNTEQRVAVVDSSGRIAPVELSRLVARLPGLKHDGRFDVSWA